MMAPARHPLMMRTLERIVAKFDAERGLAPKPEPTHTLELTGPGVFTDAYDELRLAGALSRARVISPTYSNLFS